MKGLILVLALLAAPTAAHCQQRDLPPLPDSIPTQIGSVPVVRTATPCGEPRAYGCFAIPIRVIYVRDSLSRLMEWKVLLHEVGHLRLFDARIRIGDEALEDRIVDMWAMYQLAAMLRQ